MSTLASNEKGDLPQVAEAISQAKTGDIIHFPQSAAPRVDFDSATGAEIDEEEFPEDYPDYDPDAIPTLLNQEEISIRNKREDVRGQLAIIYTVATFMMFVFTFIVAVLDGLLRQTSIVDGLTTLIPLVSGVFLGSLGFVLGYYFRKVEDE
jgi:hypothetical protein